MSGFHWTEQEVQDYLRRLRGPALTAPPAPDTGELERDFQGRLRRVAHALGYRIYHTRDARGSDKGWFDLAMAHAGQGRLILAELKRTGGKQTEAQRDWYADLQRITRVEAYLWYPADYAEAVAVLRGEG